MRQEALMAPCSLVGAYCRLGAMYCLHLQGRRISRTHKKQTAPESIHYVVLDQSQGLLYHDSPILNCV
jgi:hypothetical protein